MLFLKSLPKRRRGVNPIAHILYDHRPIVKMTSPEFA